MHQNFKLGLCDFFYDVLKIFLNITLHFFTFYLVKNNKGHNKNLRHASLHLNVWYPWLKTDA